MESLEEMVRLELGLLLVSESVPHASYSARSTTQKKARQGKAEQRQSCPRSVSEK
jgi:hypothetical protein